MGTAKNSEAPSPLPGAGAEERSQGEIIGCNYNLCLSPAFRLTLGYEAGEDRNRWLWHGEFSHQLTPASVLSIGFETRVRAAGWHAVPASSAVPLEGFP